MLRLFLLRLAHIHIFILISRCRRAAASQGRLMAGAARYHGGQPWCDLRRASSSSGQLRAQ
jgi:hypothetical protein